MLCLLRAKLKANHYGSAAVALRAGMRSEWGPGEEPQPALLDSPHQTLLLPWLSPRGVPLFIEHRGRADALVSVQFVWVKIVCASLSWGPEEIPGYSGSRGLAKQSLSRGQCHTAGAPLPTTSRHSPHLGLEATAQRFLG